MDYAKYDDYFGADLFEIYSGLCFYDLFLFLLGSSRFGDTCILFGDITKSGLCFRLLYILGLKYSFIGSISTTSLSSSIRNSGLLTLLFCIISRSIIIGDRIFEVAKRGTGI